MQEAGEQAERITEHGQPAEEKAPDPVALKESRRPCQLPIVNTKYPTDQKIGTPYANQVSGAGAEKISDSGDTDQSGRLLPLNQEEDQQPL